MLKAIHWMPEVDWPEVETSTLKSKAVRPAQHSTALNTIMRQTPAAKYRCIWWVLAGVEAQVIAILSDGPPARHPGAPQENKCVNSSWTKEKAISFYISIVICILLLACTGSADSWYSLSTLCSPRSQADQSPMCLNLNCRIQQFVTRLNFLLGFNIEYIHHRLLATVCCYC